MSSQQNQNPGQMNNVPAPMTNPAEMPQMMESYPQMAEPAEENPMESQPVYPEICYKLHPYITTACDFITSLGDEMPTQQQFDHITDSVYEDFCRTNPDLAEYMSKSDQPDDPPAEEVFRSGYGRGYYRPFRPSRYFRRRGLGRDFIAALLLSELLSRGGYYYY